MNIIVKLFVIHNVVEIIMLDTHSSFALYLLKSHITSPRCFDLKLR